MGKNGGFPRNPGDFNSKIRGFMKNRGLSWTKGGFRQGSVKNRGFWWKTGGFNGIWSKIGVLVENGGFFEKWGFRGFLVKNSGKSREEPGI